MITKEQLRDMILEGKDITKVDYSHITNMGWMFDGCKNLTSIPDLDTSNVTSMYCMFRNCTNLTSIPYLDTSNVTSMYCMFEGSANLERVPYSFLRYPFDKEMHPKLYKNMPELFI